MSVRVGDRSLSKIEVLYQALKLHEEVTKLSFRAFGIRSRNSPLRRKYEQLLNYEDSAYINKFILDKRDTVEFYSNQIVDLLNAANSIYPTFKAEYELRLNYQNKALSACEMLSKELNNIVQLFDADINCFKTVVQLLDNEKHLIREWRKYDRQRFKGYLL